MGLVTELNLFNCAIFLFPEKLMTASDRYCDPGQCDLDLRRCHHVMPKRRQALAGIPWLNADRRTSG